MTTVIDRLIKRDAFGGTPLWWQWFIPRYGAWGGVGWSAGRWNNDPGVTDWSVDPLDAMDALFKEHDRAYQSGVDWAVADMILVADLRKITVSGMAACLYRIGAMVVFTLHARWRAL